MGIVYNGGQHAREWISPMTNAWIANQLVTLYGKDAQITNFVDNIEWTIIPIVNVDGYVYTWTTDRMWRKNRYVLILLNLVVARVRLADVCVRHLCAVCRVMWCSRINKESWAGCVGVDVNRNWEFHWNEGGSSSNTCAEDYMGKISLEGPCSSPPPPNFG